MTDTSSPRATFTPHPAAVTQEAQKRSDTECNLALQVLAHAVKATEGSHPTKDDLATYAETLWQWVTTDAWPPHGGGA